MTATPRRSLLRAARAVLAWWGAVLYPPVLFFAVTAGSDGFTVVEVLPVCLLTVLVASLLRRGPLPALALLEVGWFAATMQMPTQTVGALHVVITDLAVGYVAATRSRRVAITAATMVLAAQSAAALLFVGYPDLPNALGLIVLATVVATLTGDSIRQRRRLAEQLAAQATAQAVTAEQLRIARELHDMVAHSIGIIAIQAGMGGRVIDTQPAEARRALTTIETTSRETLAGLRRMLGALRRAEPDAAVATAPGGPAPGLADLDRLGKSTLDAGVRIEVQWRGERRPLPPDIDLSAFRIIQEAVTNVVRHAATDHCRVSIDHRDGELLVEIIDDGTGHGLPGTGYGLVGIRERVDLLGGRLSAGPRPEGGFRVQARLPVPEKAR